MVPPLIPLRDRDAGLPWKETALPEGFARWCCWFTCMRNIPFCQKGRVGLTRGRLVPIRPGMSSRPQKSATAGPSLWLWPPTGWNVMPSGRGFSCAGRRTRLKGNHDGKLSNYHAMRMTRNARDMDHSRSRRRNWVSTPIQTPFHSETVVRDSVSSPGTPRNCCAETGEIRMGPTTA
jgi:hypothetical protein